jgi:putative ABC transport system permease protein
MSFLSLVLRNIWNKKARSSLIAAAIAFGVMTVVTLNVASHGLEHSAADIVDIGKANFTVAEKGQSDILSSTIDKGQLARLAHTPGVASAIGVLVETEKINAANPIFLEIGIQPQDMAAFGVTTLVGHPFAADARHEVMLGWRAAQNLGLTVGDTLRANRTTNRIVGIFSTGDSIGDSASMFPLVALQAYNDVPGDVTLAFVKTAPGASVSAVEHAIDSDNPELVAIRSAAQFGEADRNLVFLQAGATASTILAIVIGAVIVGDTMLLSLFERTREFGVLRAVGWTKRRVVSLVLAEALVLAVLGAGVGVGLSFAAAQVLESLPSLRGVLAVQFSAEAFFIGLYTAIGMVLIGGLYPALRAAFLKPLKALSNE